MMNWSEEEYQAYLNSKNHKKQDGVILVPTEKKAKYKNKITRIDGIAFRSRLEAEYYSKLKLLKDNKIIAGFSLQPQFVLVEGNEEDKAITYKADFIIFNLDGTFEIVDTKGYESQQWERTFKQFRLKYPNLKLKMVS
jgi:hypothetical protein